MRTIEHSPVKTNSPQLAHEGQIMVVFFSVKSIVYSNFVVVVLYNAV